MAMVITDIVLVDEDVLDGEYDVGDPTQGPRTPAQIVEALVQLDPDDLADVMLGVSEFLLTQVAVEDPQ
jgi:hypothetical protein